MIEKLRIKLGSISVSNTHNERERKACLQIIPRATGPSLPGLAHPAAFVCGPTAATERDSHRSTRESPTDQWSIGDVHLSVQGGSRLYAKPNPFEIGDAFDNHPITR